MVCGKGGGGCPRLLWLAEPTVGRGGGWWVRVFLRRTWAGWAAKTSPTGESTLDFHALGRRRGGGAEESRIPCRRRREISAPPRRLRRINEHPASASAAAAIPAVLRLPVGWTDDHPQVYLALVARAVDVR